jgi:hypothetical protein
VKLLLDADPAIRWQLTGDEADRARVAKEGLGAAILAAQGADGAWHLSGKPEWLTTLFSMQLLRFTRVNPAEVAPAIDRLARGFHWHESLGGKGFFEGETEACINGGVLACGGYFGRASESLLQRLLGEQKADGGWNCKPSAVSSFHSTLCVLEGLAELPSRPEIGLARNRAHEYLLSRSLFRRRSTGEVVDPEFLQLAFPPRYRYDVLRALDYFRYAGIAPDPRMGEAIRVIESRRQPDGTWLLDRAYDEMLPFITGEKVGEPSAWNTLRASRVLRWYTGA